MRYIEILENLIQSANKISYSNKDELDIHQKRTKMMIHKIFGADSHYLKDIKSISFTPGIFILTGDDDESQFIEPFEDGMKKYRNLLKVMIEDLKISTNYVEDSDDKKIKPMKYVPHNSTEIQVLIATPSDVIIARELLMDKLETKFRRDSYEKMCGKRILVNGWETLASQPGYPQDIINNELLSKTDIVIAVFKHKLGTPTINMEDNSERAPSGTAEELLYAIQNRNIENPPLGMAYFYSVAPVVSLDSIDFDDVKKEWDRLIKFRNEIKNSILYKNYNMEEEILEIVCKDLCSNIMKYFTQ